MKTILILCAAILFGGCAQTVWMKAGATQESFRQDSFSCEQQVITMYGGYANMGPGHAIYARQDIARCMESKGYGEATAAQLKQQRVMESEPTYEKPGATNEDLLRDTAACRPEDGSLRACLVSKGYRRMANK